MNEAHLQHPKSRRLSKKRRPKIETMQMQQAEELATDAADFGELSPSAASDEQSYLQAASFHFGLQDDEDSRQQSAARDQSAHSTPQAGDSMPHAGKGKSLC